MLRILSCGFSMEGDGLYREIHIDLIQFIFGYYANDSFKFKVLCTKRCRNSSEFI